MKMYIRLFKDLYNSVRSLFIKIFPHNPRMRRRLRRVSLLLGSNEIYFHHIVVTTFLYRLKKYFPYKNLLVLNYVIKTEICILFSLNLVFALLIDP